MAETHPVNIQPVGEELAIAWSDGAESYFPLTDLRRACPCAACGGEPDPMGNVQRPTISYNEKSFQLKSYTVVGGYALQPTWLDGHSTGLYSWRYLRQIADELAS